MASQFRVRILCEDPRTERFLRGLCERFGVEVIDVIVAPAGKGSASAWVLAQYAGLVRQRRSKNFQHHLGLLVHIDGDNRGVEKRKAELDSGLRSALPRPVPVRAPTEPVAIFVPTWCIETWLLHLTGLAQPPESAKLKRDPDPTYREALDAVNADETGVIRGAVAAWPGSSPPSLGDAKSEARRIGIC